MLFAYGINTFLTTLIIFFLITSDINGTVEQAWLMLYSMKVYINYSKKTQIENIQIQQTLSYG